MKYVDQFFASSLNKKKFNLVLISYVKWDKIQLL